MDNQSFDFCKLFFPFRGLWGQDYFCILCKTCYKMQKYNSITLKFGTDEIYTKVNSRVKFARNLISVHIAMNAIRIQRFNFCQNFSRVGRLY